MRNLFILIAALCVFVSCETVDPGHKGVEISWGGETNLDVVYSEGLASGAHWLWDEMVQYDVRQQTKVLKVEFNDRNSMTTAVEFALDYHLDPSRVNLLHTQVKDYNIKIEKALKSAGKEVVPQYSAVDLNIHKRIEAEEKLSSILAEELPEFYVVFDRMQITDVDLPKSVSKMAELTAEQLERNKLAEKKEAEKAALAKAIVAEAKGNFEAAEYEAKTKKILSQPSMLRLKQLEIDEIWAKKGVSPYGSNNVFGADVGVLRGIKTGN